MTAINALVAAMGSNGVDVTAFNNAAPVNFQANGQSQLFHHVGVVNYTVNSGITNIAPPGSPRWFKEAESDALMSAMLLEHMHRDLQKALNYSSRGIHTIESSLTLSEINEFATNRVFLSMLYLNAATALDLMNTNQGLAYKASKRSMELNADEWSSGMVALTAHNLAIDYIHRKTNFLEALSLARESICIYLTNQSHIDQFSTPHVGNEFYEFGAHVAAGFSLWEEAIGYSIQSLYNDPTWRRINHAVDILKAAGRTNAADSLLEFWKKNKPPGMGYKSRPSIQKYSLFVMESDRFDYSFQQFWVRKLTGKPGGATPPDCVFDARRIQKAYETDFSRAAQSKALRIHSDLLPRDLAIAARISLASSGDSLACISMPRRFDFGTGGLPILLIKQLMYDKNNC